MGKVSPRFGMRGATRLAFAAFAAALMAGCADSSRFMGDPLGNPFRSASADAGRDLPSRDLPSRDLPSRDLPSRSLPSRDMASRDMDPPPPYRPVRSAAISSRPLAPVGESRRVADYAAPAHANPRLASDYSAPRTERTASIAAPSGHGSWSSAGGMSIIAGTGDTAGVLANRYNVPTEALLHENGFSSASQIRPGTRLVIPVYSANGGGGTSRVAAEEPAERKPHDHSSRARLLAKHEPKEHEPKERELAAAPSRPEPKLAHREEQERVRTAKAEAPEPRKPHGRELAMAKVEHDKVEHDKVEHGKAEKLAKAEQLKADKAEQARTTQARADQARTAKAEQMKAEKLAKAEDAQKQAAARKLAKAEAKKATPVAVAKAAPAPAPEQKVAKLEEAPRKAAVDPTPTASLPPPAAEKVSANGNPEFRWPAHGRIIQGFKSGGNDGINIAVPEGTQVKAAESGVVAYAGNEIKGFGNLVLIRHPNGFVTAYANNGDIAVRRGEQVKRGQTIAKSGQSGNVASPQLHFELRKGSTPVDPTRYLAGL